MVSYGRPEDLVGAVRAAARRFVLALAVLSAGSRGFGAEIAWTTLAGQPIGDEDGPAVQARFSTGVSGIALDASGNVFVADGPNGSIRKVAPDGSVSTLAGSQSFIATVGPPGFARFGWPNGVAVDAAGNVYVADQGGARIAKVTPDGTVTTLAGGWPNGYVDGPGTVTRFNQPGFVAVDRSGFVYVADSGNQRIRKIAPDGTTSTLAGSGTAGFADGAASTAQFSSPSGLALDEAGNVYIADTGNQRIRKVTPSGAVSTLAGSGLQGFADGPGSDAQFASPVGVAVDSLGRILVADQWNGRIRRIGLDRAVTTVLGGDSSGLVDGPVGTARIAQPTGLAVDGAGNVYFADSANCRIRKLSVDGFVSTMAGSGVAGPVGTADGSRNDARFSGPTGVAIDSSGAVFVADSWNPRIRKIAPDGKVSTFAGSSAGYADGVGTLAQFRQPTGVAFGRSGVLYVADKGDHRIRKVAPDGTVTTLAGSGTAGFRDGVGTSAQFSSPVHLAVDGSGNVIVADQDNNRIRRIAPDGTVTTVAGSGQAGFGDGAAGSALFNSPSGVAVDGNGTIWVTELGDGRVRMISGGMVTSLPGSAAAFFGPSGPAVDSLGNIYLAETFKHRIRKVAADGSVTVVGGSGLPGGNDGLGTFARFRNPQGVAVAADGTLYVADTSNFAVRVGRPASFFETATIDAPAGAIGQRRQLGTTGSGATGWNWQVTARPAGSAATLSSAGVRAPTFTPDAPGEYLFRLTASDGKEQCVSEVRLGPAMPYPRMYSVPTDMSRIPYPDFYRQLVPKDVYLVDPYCPLTQDVVSYPADYLDIARLPDVSGDPLPSGVIRAISMKDFWFPGAGGNPTFCNSVANPPTMREAFVSSLARVKALGADYIGPYQTFQVPDFANPLVTADIGIPLPEMDLAFIAAEAKKAGIEVILRLNLGLSAPAIPSREWFAIFIDSFAKLQVSQARLAQKYGIAAFQLNWEAWGVNLNGVRDLYDARLTQAVQEIRQFYDGKILLSDQISFDTPPENVFSAVDMIMAGPTAILSPEKAGNYTMQDLHEAYAGWFSRWSARYGHFGKPLYLEMFIQSQPDFLVSGWIEEGGCLPGCPQLGVRTDFASQAMAFEALFEEAVAAHQRGSIRLAAAEPVAYWYSDPLMPPAALYGSGMFPNISQNIRNKPAESIVYKWFKRPASVVVPVVVSSTGATPGSFFTSDITLTNRGTTNANITYTYTAAAGGASGTATDSLPAGHQKIVRDAIEYLRGLGVPVGDTGNRVGTLRIDFGGLSSDDAAAVTVRTGTPVPEGRAGLAYSGLRPAELLSAPAFLCGLRQNAFDRSNVAVINAGDASAGDITLRLTVTSGDPGSPLTQVLPDISLSPGGFQQITGILGSNGLSVANGFVKVERVSGSAPYYAYGVINDQANSDGSFVEPVAASLPTAASSVTLPALVETSSFSSELVVTNLTTRSRTLRCEFVASALTGGRVSFAISLLPYEQQILPAFVQLLRDRGVVRDAPGPAFAGALFVADDARDISGISVGSRTLTGGGGGRYGVYSAAVPGGSEARTKAWLFGLQQDAETRTNLTIVNTGQAGSATGTFRVDLFDGATGQKAGSVDGVSVPAQGFVQIGMILAQYAPAASSGYALVTKTSGDGPFVAYAVLNDGAAPGLRSGDGAFVKAYVPADQ